MQVYFSIHLYLKSVREEKIETKIIDYEKICKNHAI